MTARGLTVPLPIYASRRIGPHGARKLRKVSP